MLPKKGNKINPRETEIFFRSNFAQYHNIKHYFIMMFKKQKFFIKIKEKKQVLIYLDEIESDTLIFYIPLN